MVAGGSLRAVEAILRGDVEHAFHPGGGLHHAMPDRASGFCIYDDPALAIARARRDWPARPVRRPRCPSRRRRPGDPLGRSRRPDPVDPRDRAVPVPGQRRRRRDRGGECRRDGRQRAHGAVHRGGALAGGHPLVAPRAGRCVRAGPDRVPARRGLACVGSTRAPADDDDRDGRGRATGGRGRPSVRRRAMARDRRRRLRRVPRGAADVEPRLAGRCPPRGPGGDSRDVARAPGRPRRLATDRRRCRRRSSTPRMRAWRSTGTRRWRSRCRARPPRPSVASSCRACFARPGTAAGGIRLRARVRQSGSQRDAAPPGRTRGSSTSMRPPGPG